jgi:hypothetical protein
MKRLRHPIRAIREPFGTAGLIVAMVALVAALGGTALAAKGALTGKQKKEVTAIAKKFAGQPGPAGPAGAQGPAGANGKDGANGSNGAPGEKGDQGVPGVQGIQGEGGEPGESPVGSAFTIAEEEAGNPPGAPCHKAGGVLYEVESTGDEQVVCNGAPWTPNNTLPVGATETGTFATSGFSKTIKFKTEVAGVEHEEEFVLGNKVFWVAAPFPIKLAAALSSSHVFFASNPAAPSEAFKAACGEPVLLTLPLAKSGNLCVYVGKQVNAELKKIIRLSSSEGSEGASAPGALLKFEATGEGTVEITGSWAVTG